MQDPLIGAALFLSGTYHLIQENLQHAIVWNSGVKITISPGSVRMLHASQVIVFLSLKDKCVFILQVLSILF